MYLRTVRVTKKGKSYEYLQLAHNRRDRKTGQTRVEVLYSFGRADDLDTDALRRLVRSVSRYLEPSEARAISERLGDELPFEFLGSRELGGS